MLTLGSRVLAPMVDKLTKHSQLRLAEASALLELPFRSATVERDSYLVREGDKAGSCIILLSGFTYRSKTTGDGTRQILSIHMRGDLIDLQNSLLEHADHNVQALTRAKVAYVSHQAIFDIVDRHPAIARAFWRDSLIDGSIFREWILNIGQRNARRRISHVICEVALRQEEAGVSKGPQYEWPLTQEHLADATGLTAVHVNRTLQGMRRDGLIIMNGGSVTIPDRQRLQDAGDFTRAYLHQFTGVVA